MKTILLTLLTLPLFAQAQYREVSGDFFPNAKVEKSYLVNGYFEKNTNAVTATTHTAVRNTSSPIQGAGDLQITAGAAGNTRINTLAWEKRLEGQNCELAFKYVGGGGTWTAQIWDGSLNVLVSRPLPAVTLVSPISINYPCGSASGRTIRFVTTASAPQLNVDEIYYGIATNIISLSNSTDWISYAGAWEASTTNPVLGNGVAVYEYRLNNGHVQVRGSIQRGSTTVAGSGTYRITAPPGFTFKTTPGQVNANYIIGKSNYYSNTTTTAAQVGSLIYQTTDNKMVFSTDQNAIANGLSSGQTNVFNATGDILFWFGEYPVTNLSATQQAVTQQCIQDGSCENTFSAFINSAGVVSGENIEWITGNCSVVGSARICTLRSNLFSVAPNCTVSQANTGGVITARIDSISTTSLSASTYNTTGAATVSDFYLICSRASTDSKPRFAAPILTGSVTSNSASPLRIETAYIQTNGNVLFGSTPGFFSCGATLPRTCTFAQAFAANPVCTAVTDARARIAAVTSVTTTATILDIGNLAGASSNDANTHLTCIGPRLQ